MKALIHLDQNGKKVMERRVHEAVMKERADISTRAQYVWALSMLQCGLSPQTVQRVVNHFDAVVDKYMEHAGRKELCVWASEIEEFPIAVTKKWFPEVEDGKLF